MTTHAADPEDFLGALRSRAYGALWGAVLGDMAGVIWADADKLDQPTRRAIKFHPVKLEDRSYVIGAVRKGLNYGAPTVAATAAMREVAAPGVPDARLASAAITAGCMSRIVWGGERSIKTILAMLRATAYVRRLPDAAMTPLARHSSKDADPDIQAIRAAHFAYTYSGGFPTLVRRTAAGGGNRRDAAALAGALIGARDGVNCLPAEWVACVPDATATRLDSVVESAIAIFDGHRATDTAAIPL